MLGKGVILGLGSRCEMFELSEHPIKLILRDIAIELSERDRVYYELEMRKLN